MEFDPDQISSYSYHYTTETLVVEENFKYNETILSHAPLVSSNWMNFGKKVIVQIMGTATKKLKVTDCFHFHRYLGWCYNFSVAKEKSVCKKKVLTVKKEKKAPVLKKIKRMPIEKKS